MFRSSIEKKLRSVSTELRAQRETLAMIEEQLLHVSDEAEDLRLRAIVSETPLAQASHRDAAKTVAALRTDKQRCLARLAELEQKQDDLLDRLGQ